MTRCTGMLPPEPSSFIGRAAELTELRNVQAGAHMLTIVGPGGVGKTRLGLRLADLARGAYPDGVYFVDLAPAADAAMLAHSVARTLDVRTGPGQSTLQAIVQRLRKSHMLLVLDSCERLLDACSEFASALLESCPHMQLLAISREPLDTDGDAIWRVPPLSVPVASAAPTRVAASEAVQLFVSRARAQDPRFSLTVANSEEVGAVCRDLGGMPLALELVAARIGDRVSSEIGSQLRLAEPHSVNIRRRGSRQIMLRTLDWTHRQLGQSERVLFRRLAVFASGWDQAIAAAVCSDERLSATAVVTGLDRLVAMSLIIAGPQLDGTGRRYRWLDSVHSYALEQLLSADEYDAIHRRLLEYMVSLAERVAPEVLNADHAALLDRELENLRTALFWAIASGAAQDALRLAIAACSLWYSRGYYAEGCDWLERGLALTGEANTLTRARAAAWLGQLLQIRGEYKPAEKWITYALERHQALGDPMGCALSIAMLGQLLLMRGDLARAQSLCACASERFSELGNSANVASRLQSAVIAIELGHLESATRVLDECAAQQLDADSALAAWLRFHEGRLAEARGDFVSANKLLSEALHVSRAIPEQQAIITALVELGHVQLARGFRSQAMASFAEALDLVQHSGERIQMARALEGLARASTSQQPAVAVRVAAAADKLRSVMGAQPWPSDASRLATWLPSAQRALTPYHYRAAWKAGHDADLDQSLALARTLTAAGAPQSRAARLTRREQEIVALLGRALTTRQIAAELSISPATARTHVEHVLSKLGLHTRAQVVLWASRVWEASRDTPQVAGL